MFSTMRLCKKCNELVEVLLSNVKLQLLLQYSTPFDLLHLPPSSYCITTKIQINIPRMHFQMKSPPAFEGDPVFLNLSLSLPVKTLQDLVVEKTCSNYLMFFKLQLADVWFYFTFCLNVCRSFTKKIVHSSDGVCCC